MTTHDSGVAPDFAFMGSGRDLEAAMHASRQIWQDGPRIRYRGGRSHIGESGMKVNSRGWPSDERLVCFKVFLNHVTQPSPRKRPAPSDRASRVMFENEHGRV